MTRPGISVVIDARGRAVVRSTIRIDPYSPDLSNEDRIALAAELLDAIDTVNIANGDPTDTHSLFPDTVPDNLTGGA